MGTTRRAVVAAAGIIALVVTAATARDVARADGIRVVVRTTPAILPGDNATQATITLRYLNSDGTPRAGDVLTLLDVSQNTGTILREGSGIISIFRVVTNAQGRVSFRYIAAMSNSFVPTLPAHILITDTSLGSILEIDRTTTITIDVVDPAKIHGGKHGGHA